MIDTRLPMTVIGGYLGAGKTTLINRLLAEPHGKRLMLLVNDFGAINIDADLLDSADEDTLTLTNGCVCCTMGSDLFMAISDVLKRAPRPDHLIIEASGVADPYRIANTAIAEPEMRYAGIVTVVDAENFQALSDAPLIGPQIAQQVACADLVYVSKSDGIAADLMRSLRAINQAQPVILQDGILASSLLLAEHDAMHADPSPASHPNYAQLDYSGDMVCDYAALSAWLAQRPKSLFRVKGFVMGPQDQGWLVQVVGQNIAISPIANPAQSTLVAIGLLAATSGSELHDWWPG